MQSEMNNIVRQAVSAWYDGDNDAVGDATTALTDLICRKLEGVRRKDADPNWYVPDTDANNKIYNSAIDEAIKLVRE